MDVFRYVEWITRLSAPLGRLVDKNEIGALLALSRFQNDSLRELFRCVEYGEKPVAWTHSSVPPEILHALDIKPFPVLEWSSILVVLNPSALEPYMDRAFSAGTPNTVCSSCSAMLGLLLEDQWPPPDLILNSLGPCDNLGEPLEAARELRPAAGYFALDGLAGRDAESYGYMAEQLAGMIRFLEEETGRKLTYEKLRERVELSNRYWEMLLDVLDLARARPCPAPAKWFAYNVLPRADIGHPRANRWAAWLQGEARRRRRAGKGTSPFEERLRAVQWSLTPVFNLLSFWERLEADYGLSAVFSFSAPMGCGPVDTSSYDSILMGLARNMRGLAMTNQVLGSAEEYAADLSRAIEDYSADLVVFTDHRGCKNTSVLTQMFREVCAELGAPLVVVDGDALDPRIAGDEEMRAQIGAFLETRRLA